MKQYITTQVTAVHNAMCATTYKDQFTVPKTPIFLCGILFIQGSEEFLLYDTFQLCHNQHPVRLTHPRVSTAPSNIKRQNRNCDPGLLALYNDWFQQKSTYSHIRASFRYFITKGMPVHKSFILLIHISFCVRRRTGKEKIYALAFPL
jgi:hypothetical protein